MDTIENDAEILAAYLIGVAKSGRSLPRNMEQCARAANLPPGCIGPARKRLIKDGRLIYNNMAPGKQPTIDGVEFSRLAPALPDVEAIKDCLRRFYCPVVDIRTLSDENKVAVGEPEALIVGCQLLTFAQAVALARHKAVRYGLSLTPPAAGPRGSSIISATGSA